MAIEWSKTLSTGILWQDTQHKELFRKINNLLDAMSAGLGKEEVKRLFKFLDDYFVGHFEAEEHAMNSASYPDMLSHLVEHTRFIEDVAALKKECAGGVTGAFVMKVEARVVDWLINHIGSADKAMAGFILKATSKN